jgi:hypothetical protein
MQTSTRTHHSLEPGETNPPKRSQRQPPYDRHQFASERILEPGTCSKFPGTARDDLPEEFLVTFVNQSVVGASTSRHGAFNSDLSTWLHRLFKASKVNDIIRIYKSGENIAAAAGEYGKAKPR